MGCRSGPGRAASLPPHPYPDATPARTTVSRGWPACGRRGSLGRSTVPSKKWHLPIQEPRLELLPLARPKIPGGAPHLPLRHFGVGIRRCPCRFWQCLARTNREFVSTALAESIAVPTEAPPVLRRGLLGGVFVYRWWGMPATVKAIQVTLDECLAGAAGSTSGGSGTCCSAVLREPAVEYLRRQAAAEISSR